MKRIRILFDMGDGLHTARWCGAMVRRGFECHVIHRDPAFTVDGAIMHRLSSPVRVRSARAVRALKREFDAWRRFGPIADISAAASRVIEYREIAARVNPALLHITLKDRGYWAALSGITPLVVSILGADLYDDARWDERFHAAAVHLFRRAAAITADTPHAAEVIEGWNCDPRKFHEVHWGVDGKLFRADGPMAEATADLPRPLFFCNRSAVPNSCLDTVLRAYARVRARRRCSLVMGGRLANAETDSELRALIAAHAIPDVRIVSAIPHEDLPGWYRAADVFISVPYSDGTSVSVTEAMASRLPLVLSDIPPNRALVARGAAALLVPVMDAEKLASALSSFLRTPALARSMGMKNLRAAIRYDARRQMDMMAAIYRRVLSGSK